MRYQKTKDGQWIRPKMKGWKMKCCDCGLVHRFNFRLAIGKGGRVVVELQAFRCKG